MAELEAAPELGNRYWTEFEDDMVRKYYPTKGGHILAKALKRPYNNVKARANILGVKRL